MLSFEQCRRLAQAWYRGRGSAAWRGRTREEAQALFAAVGLTGPFWTL